MTTYLTPEEKRQARRLARVTLPALQAELRAVARRIADKSWNGPCVDFKLNWLRDDLLAAIGNRWMKGKTA